MFVRTLRQVKVSSDWCGSVKTHRYLVDDEWKTISLSLSETLIQTNCYKGEFNKKTHRQGRKTCDLCGVFING